MKCEKENGGFAWLLALKVVEIGLLLALHYAFDFDWLEACAITATVAIGFGCDCLVNW